MTRDDRPTHCWCWSDAGATLLTSRPSPGWLVFLREVAAVVVQKAAKWAFEYFLVARPLAKMVGVLDRLTNGVGLLGRVAVWLIRVRRPRCEPQDIAQLI